MALTGDTVRLVVHFKTFENVPIQPDEITLTIYDNEQTVLKDYTEDNLEQNGIGKYYYDYIVPENVQDYLIYEYKGIHNNKPILSRGKVRVRFNKS